MPQFRICLPMLLCSIFLIPSAPDGLAAGQHHKKVWVSTSSMGVTGGENLGDRNEKVSRLPSSQLLNKQTFPSPESGYYVEVDTATVGSQSIFFVTNTADTGAGSFRRAIQDANDNPGPDLINFGIATGGQTITPLSQLPAITSPVGIDGTTQPGYLGIPLIELKGTNVGIGLYILAGSSTVRGLVVNDCVSSGIVLQNMGNNIIESNYIGTNAAGNNPIPNKGNGVFIVDSPDNRVGDSTALARNIISGNYLPNVAIYGTGSHGNIIRGNYIGIDVTGTIDISPDNASDGVLIRAGASNNLIGGPSSGEGNVISGNHSPGIFISEELTSDNVVQGNIIGLDVSGQNALGNGNGIRITNGASYNIIGGTTAATRNIISGNFSPGIAIDGPSTTNNTVAGNIIGTSLDYRQNIGNPDGILIKNSPSNTIGGTATGAGNLITGNVSAGIAIIGSLATGNRVEGNRIGAPTDLSVHGLGNLENGVFIQNASGNTIGGTSPPTGNYIGDNYSHGIVITGDTATDNMIQGNHIGADAVGVIDRGNFGHGILLLASGNTIGGDIEAFGNMIAHNAGAGVYDSLGVNNIIRSNSIYSNQGLGIDIAPPGPNLNDNQDADGGPNNRQNYPVIDSVLGGTNSYTIKGSLNSTPNSVYELQLYENTARDPSGYGEGEALIGTAVALTDDAGNATFETTITGSALPGGPVAATATDDSGNTSEFSRSPKLIELTRPLVGELWLTADVDTIRWRLSTPFGLVGLELSTDGGTTFSDIASPVVAANEKYLWTIEKGILSKKCKIRIYAFNDETIADTSQLFKIKGYELTRDSAGQYERYVPGRHGWSFGNGQGIVFLPAPAKPDVTNAVVFPQSYYNQFDYISGLDPNSGLPYPLELFLPARPQDFPDWPSFVRTFGTSQCYFDLSMGIYKPRAVEKWRATIGSYGGSCFGLATASILAFDDSMAFKVKFPNFGNLTNIFALSISDNRRKVIHQLFTSQFGLETDQYYTQNISKSPKETLKEVKEMLKGEIRNDRIMVLFNQQGSGGHAVNPYKVEQSSLFPNRQYIYVYDNNSVAGDNLFFTVDTLANTWDYNGFNNWGGNKGIFLELPAVNYLGTPTLRGSQPSGYPILTQKSNGSGTLEFFNSSDAFVTVTNTIGDSIGYADSIAFNTLANAVPIIPITGGFHPPIGYRVPQGEDYTIVMKNFSDTITHFAAFTDSSVFSFTRSNVLPSESDHIQIGNGLTLSNPDNTAKRMDVETIIIHDNNEKVVGLGNTILPLADTLHLDVANRRNVKISNTGDTLRYDLRLRLASAEENLTLSHSNIAIPPNSSQLVLPEWETLLNRPIKILVDHGNDGTIDDSLFVSNEENGWSGSPTVNTPISLAFLAQSGQQIAGDGKGGAIISWTSSTLANGTFIFVQRIDTLGKARWKTNGIPVSSAPDNQQASSITTDGAGGAIIAWENVHAGSHGDISTQRVNEYGEWLWAAEGMPVSTVSTELITTNPVMASDNNGGAIIIWTNKHTGVTGLYAQRVDATGARKWSTNGILISSSPAPYYNYSYGLITGEDGTAIIVWEDVRDPSNKNIYTQKIDSSGIVQWSANGVVICGAPDEQSWPGIVTDGDGGAIISWQDLRGGSAVVYCQRVNNVGEAQWTVNGIQLASGPGVKFYPAIVADGSGGAIIGWNDTRRGGLFLDFYAQHISFSGTALWKADGVAISDTAKGSAWLSMVSDLHGGAIAAFSQDRGTAGPDLFAQRIDSSGTARWQKNGVPVSQAQNVQNIAVATSDNGGGIILAWRDSRPVNAGSQHIFAQNVSGEGALGNGIVTDVGPVPSQVVSSYKLMQNYPNPFNPNTIIRYDIPRTSYVTLKVYNVLGQEVTTLVNEDKVAGAHEVHWNAGKFSSGVYFYRLSAGLFTSVKKMLLVK